MTPRRVLLSGAALAALTAICVFLLDAPVDRLMRSFDARPLADPFVTAIEFLFAFELSKFATGAAIVLVALVLFAWRRNTARLLLYVGLAQLSTRLIAGVLKNVFLRTRPFQGRDVWFVEGGSSFPSGHAAHFWGLAFALAIAFPRLRVPAVILAILVSLSRVAVHDHYLSDVLGSAAIAAFVAWAWTPLIRNALTQR
jgi:membrane-associated phospholipid phosphatase